MQEFVVGEIKGVHIREVYIFISGVSILERCPHFRGVLGERGSTVITVL